MKIAILIDFFNLFLYFATRCRILNRFTLNCLIRIAALKRQNHELCMRTCSTRGGQSAELVYTFTGYARISERHIPTPFDIYNTLRFWGHPVSNIHVEPRVINVKNTNELSSYICGLLCSMCSHLPLHFPFLLFLFGLSITLIFLLPSIDFLHDWVIIICLPLTRSPNYSAWIRSGFFLNYYYNIPCAIAW